MTKKLTGRALARFEAGREIWQEVLDGVREIKAGRGKWTSVERRSPSQNAPRNCGVTRSCAFSFLPQSRVDRLEIVLKFLVVVLSGDLVLAHVGMHFPDAHARVPSGACHAELPLSVLLRVVVELPLVDGVAEEFAHGGGPVALLDALDLFQVLYEALG